MRALHIEVRGALSPVPKCSRATAAADFHVRQSVALSDEVRLGLLESAERCQTVAWQDLPSTLPIASTATTRTTSSTTQTSRLLPSGSGGGADGGGSASRRLPSRPPAPTASASGNSPTKPC